MHRSLDEALGADRTVRPGSFDRARALFGRLLPTRRNQSDAVPADRLHALLAIARRLTEALDRREVFRAIVEETTRALGADATTIRVLNGDHLELVAWAGIDDGVAARLPHFRTDEAWYPEILRTGRPLVCEDVRASGDPGYRRYAGVIEFAAHIVVPLIHEGRVIGAFSSVAREPRRWTPQDVEFVTVLASHASIAISNAELFERTETRAAQLAVLQAASARMSRASTVEAVGRAIVEETGRVVDYHNARVHVLEPPDRLVPVAFEGRVGAYELVDLGVLECRVGEGFTGWVARHGRPILVADANADPRGRTILGTDDVDESMLVVPMRYDATVVGVIALSKLGIGQFGEEDLQLLSILADQAATAMETARLLDRTERLASELRRLLDMSGALSRSLDPRQVANLMAAHLADVMGVDECAVSYWDRGGGRILTLGYYPPTPEEELEPSYEVADFPETLRVLRDLETAIVDVDDPAADPGEVRLLREEGLTMLAMLPLVVKGEATGLVELMSRTRVRFDEQRLELARTMANEAAMALENARLYDDARSLADRNPLTGFQNHRSLHERLGAEVVRAKRSRRPLGVLMLDLDDFKTVNDTFGHQFGDKFLVWVAERIRTTLRSSDVPARYGGDEFAIVLPESDGAAAREAARRILDALHAAPFDAGERGLVPIEASIGIASYPDDGRSATELIAAADRGLYRVKRGGGDGVDEAGGDDRGQPIGAPSVA